MELAVEVQRLGHSAAFDTHVKLTNLARSMRDSQVGVARSRLHDGTSSESFGSTHSQPKSVDPDPQLQRELEAVRAMVHERDAEIERLLRDANERLESSHQEKRSLSETVASLQQENTSLKAHLASMEGKARELELGLVAASTTRSAAGDESVKALLNLQTSYSTLEAQYQSVAAENQQLKKDLQDAMLKLAATSTQFQDSKKALESAKNIQSNADSTAQTLQGTVKELQAELHRLRDMSTESTRILMEASQKAANSTGIKDLQLAASMPNVNSVSLAAAVSGQLSTLVREFLERDQTCREATYEQAKAVNTSTQAQLQACWKETAHLKEECSRKDAAVASIRNQLAAEANRVEDRERTIAQKEKEMTRLAETVRNLETQLTQVQCQVTMEAKGQANAEELISNLRYELLEREKEIIEAQRAVANLQSVLEQFKAQRQSDIAEQTDYLNHEIETMRTQLAAEVAQRAQRNEAIEQLKVQHQKDIAQKNVAMQGLQTRLKELRKVLEETATKMNDDHSIDKRVVSHLLVNYIHSTVEQRPDTDDQVRVMSGLLNWDATMGWGQPQPGPTVDSRAGTSSWEIHGGQEERGRVPSRNVGGVPDEGERQSPIRVGRCLQRWWPNRR
jgi:chromosome segregation ATPase